MLLPLRFAFKAVMLAAVSTYATLTHAVAPFVVKDIRIEGLRRIEAGTVFAYLPLKQGQAFTDEKGSQMIRALYATGFFSDVRVQAQGDLVVVQVQERPIVASIDFAGLREFDKESLSKMLRGALGLSPGHYYDKNLIDKAAQELKRRYLTRGYYAAEVTTTVTPFERSQVNLLFSVTEGPVARIRQVNFIGNQAFKTSTLEDEMQLSPPNWFSWYTRNDLYAREKLENDLEGIRSYYHDKGYLEFDFESTQVSISPDKKDIYLTFNLHEGKPYTVTHLELSGELLDKKEELLKLVKIRPGERFSAAKLRAANKALTDRLGEYGYAFATVTPQQTVDQQRHTLALNLQIKLGQRVYVRRVNVIGNNRTRDEVIRREMRQFESAWFDGQRLKLSQDRVNRLGYFTDVNVAMAPVEGTNDQVDVDVKVVEKPTGAVNVGAGFSSTDKVVLSAGVSQDNVFGSGTSLAVNVNTAKTYRTLSITQIDPYFTMDGIKRITEAYYRTYQPLLYGGSSLMSGSSNFRIISIGGNLKFGIPFSEFDTVYLGAGFEQDQMKADQTAPKAYRNYIDQFGRVVNNVPLTIGWARDSRDSALVPSRGYYTQANGELGTPAGDTQYYKIDLQQQYYYSFARGFVLGLNGQLGYGRGLSGKPYPIFKNYYAGGIGSVRGYEPSSLGPKDTESHDAIGGSKMLVGNIELTFPLPKTGYDRTLRLFTFIDGGNVWGADQQIALGSLRYGYGLGLAWISPVGPLKFSLGFPLSKKQGDSYQKFQFQLGTAF